MKSLKYAGIAICSMLTMASCSEEEIVSNNSQQIKENYTITVSRVLESRTWLPEEPINKKYPTYWSTDDKIEVASGDRKVRGKLSLYEGGNTENAKFKGLVNGAHSKLEYAVFPVPNSKGEIDLTARSYKSPNAPMIGTFGSDKSQVNFENTCGMFRLVINNYPADTDLIVNGEGISGTAKVKYDETAKKYALEYISDNKNKITITETPSETGSAVFYIPVITDQVFSGNSVEIKPTTITVTVAGTEASITKDLLIAKKVVSSSEKSTFLTLTYIPAEDGREAQLIEAWDSSADTAWYENNPDATEFTISKASELAGLAQLVNNSEANGGVNFIGKTIKLAKSINLDGKAWTPIGQRGVLSFRGTFDGQGNTISNFIVTGDDAGLFGQVWGASIQNLNIDGATIEGENAGAVIAYVHGSTETMDKPTVIQDVNVTNTTVNVDENEPLYGDISGHAVLKIVMDGEESIFSKASILAELLAKGGTVTLNEDITLIEPIEIPAGVTVTLDLAGKTISSPYDNAIENKGDLTIDGNGTFEGLGFIYSTAGKVTINSGNFYASSRWQDGVYNHTLKAENSEVLINGGNFDATVNGQTNAMFNASTGATITINGGTFKNVEGALAQFDPYLFTYEKDGKLIINDGTFYGGWRFNGETASTDIYGGNFTVGHDGQSFNANSTHKLTVYGGTFVPNTSYPGHSLTGKLNDVVAEGFQAVNNSNEEWVVLPGTDSEISAVEGLEGIYIDRTNSNSYYVFDEIGLSNLNALFQKIAPSEASVKTINLMNDVNFAGGEWEPLNSMWIEFDGNGKTISNFNAKLSNDGRRSGFWGYAGAVTIKNLTLEGVTVNGSQAGIFVGSADGTMIENCFIKGENIVNYVAGIETWSGIGAVSGVTQTSNMDVEIVSGAIITLNRGELMTDPGCIYIDDLSGHIEPNNGTITNNGSVIATGKVKYFAENQAALDAAVASGNEVAVTLSSGTYKLPVSVDKRVVISGTPETIIDLSNGTGQMHGMEYIFENVKIKGATENYKGIFHAASVTYKKCDLTGLQFLYANTVAFEDCDFDSQGKEHSIWTYGSGNVSFTDCDFVYNDRAVNVYTESVTDVNVSFNGCTFVAEDTKSKGAVEINSSAFPKGAVVSFVGCDAPAYGTMVGISGWDSTNGATASITIDGKAFNATQWAK